MKGIGILLFGVVSAMAIWAGQADIDCRQVGTSLAPCLSYLTGGGGMPPGLCCDGVKRIKAMAPGSLERQAVCECLKVAAARFPNLKPDAASGLPQKCGVPTSVPISPTTNCRNLP